MLGEACGEALLALRAASTVPLVSVSGRGSMEGDVDPVPGLQLSRCAILGDPSGLGRRPLVLLRLTGTAPPEPEAPEVIDGLQARMTPLVSVPTSSSLPPQPLGIPYSGEQNGTHKPHMRRLLDHCLLLPLSIYNWIVHQVRGDPLPSKTATQSCMDMQISSPETVVTQDQIPLVSEVCKVSTHPEQPISPELINLSDRPLSHSWETTVDPLMRCQNIVIDAYVRMSIKGLFDLGLTSKPMCLLKEETLCHPIQDPTGALFVALLVIRRNRPGPEMMTKHASGWQLSLQTRRALAAVLSICHKMTAHCANIASSIWIKYIAEEFYTPDEYPELKAGWDIEVRLLDAAQASFLSEPLLCLLTQNPLSEAEVILESLVATRRISMETAVVLRGSIFFLLGACLLEPSMDVITHLAKRVDTTSIAWGCVSLLLTLLHTSGASTERVLYRPPVNTHVDYAAQVFLRQAQSAAAVKLRKGPYSSTAHACERPHPVQQLLSPRNLERAARIYRECMVAVV